MKKIIIRIISIICLMIMIVCCFNMKVEAGIYMKAWEFPNLGGYDFFYKSGIYL